MKNFRKVLALILVVATLFSFVAMASAKSATEYSDYADVNYVEAVDVLTAIGVINGYDGAFHPADNIDRDEMAKMIAVLRNAGDFDADLYASANKFADAEGSWAEGYIAYCAQLGIIAGRNASTFDPDGKVTGIEVAKMLLCVLGFDAQKQGYVGANWQVNVLRDANKMGLLVGLADVDPYAAATRDQAAQMFLNALTAPLVAGYVSENVVKITNSLYGELGDLDKVYLNDISVYEAEKAGWEVSAHNAVISLTPLYTIYGRLSLVTGFDCYGTPGHVWTLTDALNKVLFQKHYADAPVSTTNVTTAAVVEAATKKLAADLKIGDGNYEVFIDGTMAKNWTEVANGMGYGSDVATYVVSYDKDKDDTVEVGETFVRVVVKNTYIAEVTAVNNTYGYFTVSNNPAKYNLPATELAVGDMVLYYVCKNGLNHAATDIDCLHDVVVVEPVVAHVTYGRYTGVLATSHFIADGTTYAYNWNYDNSLLVRPTELWANGTIATTANTYDIYLDANGKVMHWEPTDNTPDYTYTYVVEGTAGSKNHGTSVGHVGGAVLTADYYADLVDFTAAGGALTTADDVAINSKLYADMAARSASNYADTLVGRGVGMLARYYKTAAGAFVYGTDTNADGVADASTVGVDYANFAAEGSRLTKGSYVVTDATGNDLGLVMTDDTKIMVRTNNGDGTFAYNQYNGWRNLPATYIAEDVVTYGGNTYTNIQYFTNALCPWVLDYVFIDARYTTEVGVDFMLLNVAKYDAFDVSVYGYNTYLYTAFDALVNGEEAIVLVPNAIKGQMKLGVLYTDVVSMLGATFPNDGENLKLYVQANKVPHVEGDVVVAAKGLWIDSTGNKYLPVKVSDTAVVAPKLLAADCIMWTLTYEDLDGDKVPTVTKHAGLAGIVDVPYGTTGINTDIWYGIIKVNPVTNEVTAIYRVTGSYAETFLAGILGGSDTPSTSGAPGSELY